MRPMRYLCFVTDFVRESRLQHLSAAETRLSAALAQPRRIAIVCVVVLAGLGWLSLAMLAVGTGVGEMAEQFWRLPWQATWDVLCRPSASGGWGELALVPPMWIAMVLAMMLPTAGPMILTYAEIADTAARKREPVVSPLILTAGYVTVWLCFALAAAALQMFMLTRLTMLDAGAAGVLLSGGLFVGAGIYQFSALKQACLTQCQRPFPFFFANWTTEPRGVFRLGLRQGAYCLGCCWAMMLLTFAVGAMNVVWMAALGMLMTMEKMTVTARMTRVIGVGFIVFGAGLIASRLI